MRVFIDHTQRISCIFTGAGYIIKIYPEIFKKNDLWY